MPTVLIQKLNMLIVKCGKIRGSQYTNTIKYQHLIN